MDGCSIIAAANVSVPKREVLRRVLQDNGYSGSIGLDLLYDNYGNAVTCSRTPVIAFYGIHIGVNYNLMSNRKLMWNHFVKRYPMNAGFRQQKAAEYDRFQNLRKQLGINVEIDVVGCIGYGDSKDEPVNMVLNPPAMWWLGICDRGWVRIDLHFFLLELYDSLPRLLREDGGVELTSDVW